MFILTTFRITAGSCRLYSVLCSTVLIPRFPLSINPIPLVASIRDISGTNHRQSANHKHIDKKHMEFIQSVLVKNA